MLIAMGFVCVITGLDREEAEELITQHVYGGGNLIDIVNTLSLIHICKWSASIACAEQL